MKMTVYSMRPGTDSTSLFRVVPGLAKNIFISRVSRAVDRREEEADAEEIRER